MKLQELNIELQTYGEYRGRYLGKIKFEDENEGSVALTIDPDLSNILLAACSDNIVKVTTKVAERMQVLMQQSIEEAKQGPALTA